MTSLPVLNERPDICGPCGGQCCKQAPGISWPEELGSSPDEIYRGLVDRLRSGRWTIDVYESLGADWLHLRPAERGHENQPRHNGWGACCTFLTAGGCELRHDDRPMQCRLYIPRITTDGRACHYAEPEHAGVSSHASKWASHQDEIGLALMEVDR